MLQIYLILFLNILISTTLGYDLSSVLDNYIIGTPKVVCEETEVAMDIVTAKPFIGWVFLFDNKIHETQKYGKHRKIQKNTKKFSGWL